MVPNGSVALVSSSTRLVYIGTGIFLLRVSLLHGRVTGWIQIPEGIIILLVETRRLFPSADWPAICQVIAKHDLLLLAGSIQLFVDPPLGKLPYCVTSIERLDDCTKPSNYICVLICARVHTSTYAFENSYTPTWTGAVYWKNFPRTQPLCSTRTMFFFFFSELTLSRYYTFLQPFVRCLDSRQRILINFVISCEFRRPY